jgi:hypothetical protein
MREESPTRPGVLLRVPPVEVAAARLPWESRATAPTVSWESSLDEDFEFVVSQVPNRGTLESRDCLAWKKRPGSLSGARAGLGALESGFRAFVVVEDWVQRGVLAGECVVAEAGGFAELGVGEAFALAVEDQFGIVDEGHAVGVGKLLRAGADEVDVRALFEDEAGGLDGVAEAFDTGHAASLHAAAVHEEGVELDAAVGGEKAAAAGVEGGVVFEDGDGCFDGIEGRAAAREDGIAGFKGVADTGFVGGCAASAGMAHAPPWTRRVGIFLGFWNLCQCGSG